MCGASRSAARFTIGLVQETHVEQVELSVLLQNEYAADEPQTSSRANSLSESRLQRLPEEGGILIHIGCFFIRSSVGVIPGEQEGWTQERAVLSLFCSGVTSQPCPYCNNGDVSQTAFKISHLEKLFSILFSNFTSNRWHARNKKKKHWCTFAATWREFSINKKFRNLLHSRMIDVTVQINLKHLILKKYSLQYPDLWPYVKSIPS